MSLFRGREKKRAGWRVTVKPDGTVVMAGYSMTQLVWLSQQRGFREAIGEARRNPPAETEIRDLNFR